MKYAGRFKYRLKCSKRTFQMRSVPFYLEIVNGNYWIFHLHFVTLAIYPMVMLLLCVICSLWFVICVLCVHSKKCSEENTQMNQFRSNKLTRWRLCDYLQLIFNVLCWHKFSLNRLELFIFEVVRNEWRKRAIHFVKKIEWRQLFVTRP